MLAKIAEKGFLVESGVEELLLDRGSIEVDALISFAEGRNSFIISKSLVQDYLSTIQKDEASESSGRKAVVVERPIFRAIASEHSSNIEHIKKYDVKGKSTCKGNVGDFVSLFRNRYGRLRSILRFQPSPYPLSNFGGAKKGERCRFIGMVRSKITTKNHHLIIEIEDEDGLLKGFVSSNNSDLQKICANIVLDEVLAFDGQYKDPFFYIDSIAWPDIPINKQKKSIEDDISIAFISDVHVGSRLFLENKFRKMIEWLKGNCSNERERGIASTIKYLFVAGDLVDGIGVYPNQDRELSILDIYEQYDKFFELMESIPEYIELVFIPGNHDAVRRGDPQPPIPDEFIKNRHSNYHLGSSPSLFKVEGFNALLYHGNSLDSLIAGISGLSYSEPEKAILECLKRRHLGTVYGSNQLIPEEQDYLVIEEIPDIVHMGHIHKNGYAEYRNISVLNSGTWQDITDYQRMQGHIPTPAILPVYNLMRNALRLVDFNEPNGVEASGQMQY